MELVAVTWMGSGVEPLSRTTSLMIVCAPATVPLKVIVAPPLALPVRVDGLAADPRIRDPPDDMLLVMPRPVVDVNVIGPAKVRLKLSPVTLETVNPVFMFIALATVRLAPAGC